MTVITQGFQTGEFVLSEANSQRSRDQGVVTIAGAVALPSGTVLGRITATQKYVAHNVGAADGSQTAAAILYTPLVGVNGDYKATLFTRQAEIMGARLNGGVAVTAAVITSLAAVGLIVR